MGEPAVSLPELFPLVGLANLDMTSKGRLTGEAPEDPAPPELKAERKPSPAPFVDEEAPCIFNFSKIWLVLAVAALWSRFFLKKAPPQFEKTRLVLAVEGGAAAAVEVEIGDFNFVLPDGSDPPFSVFSSVPVDDEDNLAVSGLTLVLDNGDVTSVFTDELEVGPVAAASSSAEEADSTARFPSYSPKEIFSGASPKLS